MDRFLDEIDLDTREQITRGPFKILSHVQLNDCLQDTKLENILVPVRHELVVYVKTFENSALAKSFLDPSWKSYYRKRMKYGSKIRYCCRLVKNSEFKCAAKMWLIHHDSSKKVSLYRNQELHNHDKINARSSKNNSNSSNNKIENMHLNSIGHEHDMTGHLEDSPIQNRSKNDWIFDTTISIDMVDSYFEKNQVFSRRTTKRWKTGTKLYCRCNLVPISGPQCDAKLQVYYPDGSKMVQIYKSGEHNHDEINLCPVIKKHTKSLWTLETRLEHAEMVKDYLIGHKIWSTRSTEQNKNCKTVRYRCNIVRQYGPQCNAKMYIAYPNDSNEALIYKSGEHTHEAIVMAEALQLEDNTCNRKKQIPIRAYHVQPAIKEKAERPVRELTNTAIKEEFIYADDNEIKSDPSMSDYSDPVQIQIELNSDDEDVDIDDMPTSAQPVSFNNGMCGYSLQEVSVVARECDKSKQQNWNSIHKGQDLALADDEMIEVESTDTVKNEVFLSDCNGTDIRLKSESDDHHLNIVSIDDESLAKANDRGFETIKKEILEMIDDDENLLICKTKDSSPSTTNFDTDNQSEWNFDEKKFSCLEVVGDTVLANYNGRKSSNQSQCAAKKSVTDDEEVESHTLDAIVESPTAAERYDDDVDDGTDTVKKMSNQLHNHDKIEAQSSKNNSNSSKNTISDTIKNKNLSSIGHDKTGHVEHLPIQNRSKNNWILDTTVSIDMVHSYLAKNQIFSRHRSIRLKCGRKLFGRCNLVPRSGPQCNAKLQMFYPDGSKMVKIYKSGKHNHDEINSRPGIKKNKKSLWSLETRLEDADMVNDYLIEHKIWSVRTYDHNKYNKIVWYRCNIVKQHGPQCNAKMYIAYPKDSNEAFIYKSGEHTHESIVMAEARQLGDNTCNRKKQISNRTDRVQPAIKEKVERPVRELTNTAIKEEFIYADDNEITCEPSMSDYGDAVQIQIEPNIDDMPTSAQPVSFNNGICGYSRQAVSVVARECNKSNQQNWNSIHKDLDLAQTDDEMIDEENLLICKIKEPSPSTTNFDTDNQSEWNFDEKNISSLDVIDHAVIANCKGRRSSNQSQCVANQLHNHDNIKAQSSKNNSNSSQTKLLDNIHLNSIEHDRTGHLKDLQIQFHFNEIDLKMRQQITRGPFKILSHVQLNDCLEDTKMEDILVPVRHELVESTDTIKNEAFIFDCNGTDIRLKSESDGHHLNIVSIDDETNQNVQAADCLAKANDHGFETIKKEILEMIDDEENLLICKTKDPSLSTLNFDTDNQSEGSFDEKKFSCLEAVGHAVMANYNGLRSSNQSQCAAKKSVTYDKEVETHTLDSIVESPTTAERYHDDVDVGTDTVNEMSKQLHNHDKIDAQSSKNNLNSSKNTISDTIKNKHLSSIGHDMTDHVEHLPIQNRLKSNNSISHSIISIDMVDSYFEKNKIFSRHKTRQLNCGTKVYCRCNLVPISGLQCNAKLQIYYTNGSNIVQIYKRGEHNHDEINLCQGVKKHRSNWILETRLEHADMVKDYLIEHKIWSLRSTDQNKNSKIIRYRCNIVKQHGPQCNGKMYIEYPKDSNEALIYKSGEHTHESILMAKALQLGDNTCNRKKQISNRTDRVQPAIKEKAELSVRELTNTTIKEEFIYVDDNEIKCESSMSDYDDAVQIQIEPNSDDEDVNIDDMPTSAQPVSFNYGICGYSRQEVSVVARECNESKQQNWNSINKDLDLVLDNGEMIEVESTDTVKNEVFISDCNGTNIRLKSESDGHHLNIVSIDDETNQNVQAADCLAKANDSGIVTIKKEILEMIDDEENLLVCKTKDPSPSTTNFETDNQSEWSFDGNNFSTLDVVDHAVMANCNERRSSNGSRRAEMKSVDSIVKSPTAAERYYNDFDDGADTVNDISKQLQQKLKQLSEQNRTLQTVLHKLSEENIAFDWIQIFLYYTELKAARYFSSHPFLDEIKTWLDQISTSSPPFDEHTPYCVNYTIDRAYNNFNAFISTKQLLKSAVNATVVHMNSVTTYEWRDIKFQLIGTTDAGNNFHLFGVTMCGPNIPWNYEFTFRALNKGIFEFYRVQFEPHLLMGNNDAAMHEAFRTVYGTHTKFLMCSTTFKNCISQKIDELLEISDTTKYYYKVQLARDISCLQQISSEAEFYSAIFLFCDKWQNQSAFLSYFKIFWIEMYRNWFVGYENITPWHTEELYKTSYNFFWEARPKMKNLTHKFTIKTSLEQTIAEFSKS